MGEFETANAYAHAPKEQQQRQRKINVYRSAVQVSEHVRAMEAERKTAARWARAAHGEGRWVAVVEGGGSSEGQPTMTSSPYTRMLV